MAINVQKELKKLKKNSNGSNVQQSGQNTGRTDAEKQRVSANNAVLQKKNAEKVEDNGRTTAENQRAAANNVLLTGRTPEEKERKAESLGTPGALRRAADLEKNIQNAQKAGDSLKKHGEEIENARNEINRRTYYGTVSQQDIENFNGRVKRFEKKSDDFNRNVLPNTAKYMKEYGEYMSSPEYLKSYYQQKDKELVKEIDVAKENVAKRKDELEKEIADVNFKILNIEPENNTYPKEWGELQQKKGELERERDNLKNIVEDKKSERYYARVEYADLIKQAEYADKIKNYSVSGTEKLLSDIEKQEMRGGTKVKDIPNPRGAAYDYTPKYSDVDQNIGMAIDELRTYGTQVQQATFRAIYENEGRDAAYKYIKGIQQLLDDKRADSNYAAIRELPDTARVPVEMVVHTAAGVNDAATGLKGVVHAVTGNTDYIPDSSLQRTSSSLTADENVGTWGRIWRSSFRSFGNMAPSIIIGNAAGAIAGGLGAAAGTAAKIGQAAQSGTFFMTTAGGAYRDAINSGKPYGEAVTYGIVNGASEVYLENLIGGIEGFGKSGVQRLLTGTSAGKAISARVGNVLSKASPNVRKAANILGYWVADASSEAVEEGLQEILDPFMQTIIFSEHDDAWDGFSAGQVFEAAAAGALTSFLMGAPRNYSMSKATSQVIKGNADADTISAVVTNEELRGSFENITGIRLDGDNEAAFKQITAFQAGVNGAENIDGRTKKGTNANVSRGKSFLESLPEDFKNMSVLEAAAAISDGIENYKAKALEKAKAEGKSLTDIIKEEGTPTPEKLIKDGKTAEELHNNEEIKRAATNVSDIQLTKADLKTDNGKKTDTLQKLSKALGVPIMLYHFEESGSDGFYDSSERTIYLNEGGVKPVLTALKHEIMHDMKLVDEQNYAKLKTFLTAAYKTLYGEDAYNSYIEGKRSEYLKNTGKECSDEKASDEFCADTCMDLLTNEKFAKEFVKSRYSTAQRLKRCIEKILNKIKSVFGAEADETSLDDALMQLAKINGNVDYAEQSRGYADVRNGSTETLPKMLDYDTLRKADSMLMSALYDYAEARKRVNEGFSEVRNNQDLSIDEKKAEYERRVNEEFDKESVEDSDNANEYSYETLTAKPDMKITLLDTDIPKNEDGKVDRKKVVEIALNAVRQAGNKKNTDVDLFVHVDDTGNDLKVNTDSIRHGLYRKAETNATAAINIAELAKNAVRVNELSSRSENSDGGYIYLSAGKDAQNNGYIVRIITDKGNTEIKDVETIYAIGAKKEAVAHNRQGYGENTPFAFTASSISISDLLNIVKNNYSDILSNSVLEHFGIERGKSAVSGDVVYSFANQPAVDGNNVSEVTHAEEQSEAQSDIQNESRSEAQQNTGVSYPLANLPAHTITEDTDTRTGETIYTLKFNEHLTPEQFNSARDEIKQNGGYYSRFKKGFIFKDDTLYKAYNEVYNKGTNTADNETADSAEIGVQSNDTGRNVKETAAGLLQGVPGSGEPSDTGAVRGVRESSGDGGGNGGVSGHTQRQTGESVLSEHDAGTARSVHGHSEHVIKQVAAFIKKYAAKRNYAKKNYAPTTEMGAREFIEQETKNGYTLIDEGGAIISYLKSDGKNLSDEVKNWVNRLGKLGITVNVSDGKLKRFVEGYCAEFDGFFHKKLNEIFLSADILKEDIDAKNHELFHYIFHNYPEIADRFVNTLFSNLSDKFDPLIQSELEWIFDGYADGDIYSENNLLKLTDEITAYFITYLNFGHKNSNLFNSIINDRATVEEAFNQMLDELERARSKTDGDADLSRTQENISKGENSDVQQGVLGRQDSDNDSVRESESVQKVEKDGDTGKENRNADGISGNENGVDVRDTQEISSSAGSESGGTVDDGVRKSDVRNGNDGTGHNGTDNVDVNTEYDHLIEKADVGSQVPNADNSLQPTSKTPLVSSSASDSSVTQNSDFVNDEKENVSDSDETILKAMEVAVESGSLSTALLQRKLRLGYSETAKIMDRLEELGVIGAYEGSKPRKVLISYDDYLAMRQKLKAENGTDSTDGDISYSFNGRDNSTDKENAEITESDVITLRSIGRKSVNDFTAEDIKKAEPFARKYYAEMGAKSPFLRAWFGDWRARDNTKVSIANVKGNERGKVKNTDTGWEIQVSSKVFNETKSHTFNKNETAKPYLNYINDIVKKAVLLDSYIIPEGKTKSVNSAMMHSLYAIADMGNGNELIKLYVEELNDVNNDGTIKRAYQLQNIARQQLNAKGSEKILAQSTAAVEYTVSQLFDLVKSYDKNFKPGNASKVVNDDGTPKVVYHGTNSDFSVFDITKSRSYDETSDYDLPGFYFSENSEEAGSYGNYGEYYLDLKNPYNGDIYSLAKEKGSYRKAYDYLVSQGYDGMIVDDMGEGFTEYIVFHPNQIKSVTGNSGTFNAEDSDIYFSFNGRNKKAAEDGDEKYDYTKSFEQQVDDYKKGLIPKRDSLIVSGTPKVLRDIGFNALPVTINQQHVDYALNGTKDADHSLGESMLKQLPKALESPIAVINSDTEPNRVVAILGFTVNGKNVVAPIQIDGFATQNYLSIDSNAIASVFGKGNVLKQLVTAINGETAGKKTLYYWDKKRALALLQTARLQLPRHLPRAGSKEALSLLQRAGLQLSGGLPREGSIHSIRESGTSVNAKYENVTNSQQFKRWFGDWENSPQRASKAVDKNGKPKKLYHGTNSEINAFDLSKSGTNEGSTLGKGIYLTDVKSIAESFGKNVYELYASIKRPFDLGQRGTLSMFYNKLDKEFGISKLYGEQYSKNKLKGENSSVFDFMKSLADKNGVDVSDILQSLGFDGVHDGNEWVAYGENQVKSTDNIGLYGKDTDNIFYSFNGRNNSTDEENKYSYNRLTALDDMSVTRIVSSIPKKEDGKIDREAIISSGLNNAFKVGRRVNSDTAVVKNKYSGEEIAISKRGLKHSLDRRSAVALATLNIGEIVQNALRVNEMSPRNEHVAVSYPMVGYASDANGNKYAVLLVVNRNNDSYPTIDGVSVYETLYSHNAKKTESGVHSTRSYDDNSPLFPNSTISIAELMNVVKDQFPNVLSDDVLSHYGTSKTESNYDGILYSFNGRNSGETEQAGQSEQTDKGKYIPKGEKPFRDVNIPKEDAYGGKVSYGIRTYAEAESTPDERIATVLDDVKRGKYSHKVISDESALINAENLINTKGYAEAMQSILERVDYGFAIGKEDMALIELLLNNTQNYIDQRNALYNGVPATDLLVAAFINSASLAGQALQAVRAFKTLSPTAVLYGVESMANAENRHILAQTGRIVDEKNRQLSGQRKGITTSEVKEARKKARENGEFLYSKKQELIVIDETLKNNLLKARTADEVVAARDAIIENIASQIVTKFGEKVRAWRYMAMLTNPRTHVRNTIGNTMNMGMRGISNIVSALAEQAAQKAGLISQADRKHGIIGFDAAKKAEYRKIFEYAGDYFDANSAELKGKSRYNAAMSDIEQARKIFETGWLERLRRFNSDKLEKEDIFFMRRAFASQFAHAAVARGYTLSDISNGSISKNVIKDLMLYAAREAQRTTFREANSFANALNKVSNSSTGAGILIDAIIPFKSTPMNILREGVRYSPVSIVSGIKQIFEDYSIKNASNGAIEHIDGVGIIQKFSEGMTGTALMALGAMLYQFGMLTAGDDDKDEYNLRKAKGEQSYSLRFGNVYFDISWAAPVCMPLLAGAQAAKIFEGWDSDKGPLDKALAFGNSLLGIATPILETSMMQGVLDVIKSMRYSEDGEMIGDAVTTAMSSLILQYCPSVLAAMGRVFDDVEYRTDLPDSTNGTAEYERFLRKVANKIPFVRRLNLPGTDIMGKYEQKKNIGDYALSLAQNTFIPGYISTLTGNGAAEHLCDVLEQSGDAEFLPNYVKDFTVDGVKHKMTSQELHDFNVQRGLIYDSVIPVLEKSDWYSGLDAGIKAKVLRELRDVSNEICKYKINDGYKIGKAAYAVMKKEDNPEYFAKYLRSMSKSFIIKAKNGTDVDQADDEELAS
jgi:hypothetical protein